LIHGVRINPSEVREALGDALGRIRAEERLTWAQLGAALGKSADQVVKYVDASAEMPVCVYYRAKALFGEDFTGPADKLIGGGK
jgi:hypothetical protein